MTEWKVISTKSAAQFETELNAAMKQGYAVVVVNVKNAVQPDLDPFVAIMNRQVPDMVTANPSAGYQQ